MQYLKKTVLFNLILAALFLAGCGTARLESGGAYAPVDVNGAPLVQPDYQFFVVDSAADLAYGTINAAFEFEMRNERLLWSISPEIKRGMDKVRPTAVEARNQYARARAAYLVNPVPANLTQMQALLAKLQQISATVTAVLPSTTNQPAMQLPK
jgi:hypothetical protein